MIRVFINFMISVLLLVLVWTSPASSNGRLLKFYEPGNPNLVNRR